MKTNYENILIIDLEATCSNNNSIPMEKMEIIEIGAVMVNFHTFEILDQFQSFIKPIKFPILTEFCKTLTSISQEEIDNAKYFSEVINEFSFWLSKYDNWVFASWGNYDKKQFEQDFKLNNKENIFKGEHLNLKEMFAKKFNLKRAVGMQKALNICRLELDGTHHRGIDDALNMSKLLPFIFDS